MLLCLDLAAWPVFAQYSPIHLLMERTQSVVRIQAEITGLVDDQAKPYLVKGKGLVVRRRARAVRHVRNGAGVIVSASGLIVTNAHTVNKANLLKVTLYNNATYHAQPVALALDQDLALLKIDVPMPLKAVGWASGTIHLDDRVYTIGSSEYLKNTLSEGRVSGLGLSKHAEKLGLKHVQLIQVTFDVYYGDSGSPLFDAEGNLLGLMAAASKQQGKVSFAIPSGIIFKTFRQHLIH